MKVIPLRMKTIFLYKYYIYIFIIIFSFIVKSNLSKLILLLVFLMNFEVHAQKLIQELSIGVGPVSLRGDYGERQDNETNIGNTGYGISLAHYLNYGCGCSDDSYFLKHFKLRTQLLFHSTSLEHFGRYADGTGEGAIKLRAMTGKVNSFEIGSGLQWYFKEIKDYERSINTLSPYSGLGLGAVFSNPSHNTSLPGNLGSVSNTFPTFLPQPGEDDPISNNSDTALMVNFQAGTNYRLSEKSDLFIEARWHFYSSDFVDGLSPIGEQNESNDWSLWLSVGYVFYF